MLQIPNRFPSDVERLRRAIDADRSLNFLQRIQAVDGISNTMRQFKTTAIALHARGRLRQIREAEGHKCIREFIQRQLATQSTDIRAPD